MLSFFTSWGLESLRNRCPLWGERDVATHNSDINSTQPKFGNGLAPIALTRIQNAVSVAISVSVAIRQNRYNTAIALHIAAIVA